MPLKLLAFFQACAACPVSFSEIAHVLLLLLLLCLILLLLGLFLLCRLLFDLSSCLLLRFFQPPCHSSFPSCLLEVAFLLRRTGYSWSYLLSPSLLFLLLLLLLPLCSLLWPSYRPQGDASWTWAAHLPLALQPGLSGPQPSFRPFCFFSCTLGLWALLAPLASLLLFPLLSWKKGSQSGCPGLSSGTNLGLLSGLFWLEPWACALEEAAPEEGAAAALASFFQALFFGHPCAFSQTGAKLPSPPFFFLLLLCLLGPFMLM